MVKKSENKTKLKKTTTKNNGRQRKTKKLHTTVSSSSELNFTLPEDNFLDSFDVFAKSEKRILLEKNILKKNIRASFNRDSSIESLAGDDLRDFHNGSLPSSSPLSSGTKSKSSSLVAIAEKVEDENVDPNPNRKSFQYGVSINSTNSWCFSNSTRERRRLKKKLLENNTKPKARLRPISRKGPKRKNVKNTQKNAAEQKAPQLAQVNKAGRKRKNAPKNLQLNNLSVNSPLITKLKIDASKSAFFGPTTSSTPACGIKNTEKINLSFVQNANDSINIQDVSKAVDVHLENNNLIGTRSRRRILSEQMSKSFEDNSNLFESNTSSSAVHQTQASEKVNDWLLKQHLSAIMSTNDKVISSENTQKPSMSTLMMATDNTQITTENNFSVFELNEIACDEKSQIQTASNSSKSINDLLLDLCINRTGLVSKNVYEHNIHEISESKTFSIEIEQSHDDTSDMQLVKVKTVGRPSPDKNRMITRGMHRTLPNSNVSQSASVKSNSRTSKVNSDGITQNLNHLSSLHISADTTLSEKSFSINETQKSKSMMIDNNFITISTGTASLFELDEAVCEDLSQSQNSSFGSRLPKNISAKSKSSSSLSIENDGLPVKVESVFELNDMTPSKCSSYADSSNNKKIKSVAGESDRYGNEASKKSVNGAIAEDHQLINDILGERNADFRLQVAKTDQSKLNQKRIVGFCDVDSIHEVTTVPSEPESSHNIVIKSGKWRRSIYDSRKSKLTQSPRRGTIVGAKNQQLEADKPSQCASIRRKSMYINEIGKRKTLNPILETVQRSVIVLDESDVESIYSSDFSPKQTPINVLSKQHSSRLLQPIDHIDLVQLRRSNFGHHNGSQLLSQSNSSLNSAIDEIGDLVTSNLSLGFHQPNLKAQLLKRCGQTETFAFDDIYSASNLKKCRKIGEGVFGEVFLNETSTAARPPSCAAKNSFVLKIIPIEGTDEINGAQQKKFDEILQEVIISQELSALRYGKENRSSGFVEVLNVRLVEGRYPAHLLALWDEYKDRHGTENDNPSVFTDDQLYVVFELADCGLDLEAHLFKNADQSYSAFKQVALSLAVAESKFQFEHRDLHWGNILVKPTTEKSLTFNLNGKSIEIRTHGIKATIIDYTLSRMIYKDICLYHDLAADPELFQTAGDYQFDIYRLMRTQTHNCWETCEPFTNVLWLHYTVDKMIDGARYSSKKAVKHRQVIDEMMKLRDELLEYKSASDYIETNYY